MITTQKLIDRLSQKFSIAIIERGNLYFRNDKVKIISDTDNVIKADVYGSFVYNVIIQVDQLGFYASCDCSYFSKGYGGCKHIWATVLQTIYDKMEIFHNIDSLNVLFEHDTTATDVRDDKREEFSRQTGKWKGIVRNIEEDTLKVSSYLSHKTLFKKRLIYVIDVANSLDWQSIYLSVYYQKQNKNGSWTILKQRRVEESELKANDDRQLLSLLKGASTIGYHSSFYEQNLYDYDYHLPPFVYEVFLPIACKTGRVFICFHTGGELFQLEWDKGSPFQFKINIEEQTDDSYKVTAFFERDTELIQFDAELLATYDHIFFTKNSICKYIHHNCMSWIQFFSEHNSLHIPKQDIFDFIIQYYSMTGCSNLILPDDLRFTTRIEKFQKILRIEKSDIKHSKFLIAKVYFNYGIEEIGPDEVSKSFINTDKRDVIFRDMKKEEEAYFQLMETGLKPCSDNEGEDLTGHSLILYPSKLSITVALLMQLGWRVEAYNQPYRSASNFSLEVKSNIDWFELHGKCDFGDISVSMPDLLKSLKKGGSFIELSDGSRGVLPQKWLQKYQMLFDLGKTKADYIEFKLSQGMLLDLLLREQPEVNLNDNFQKWRMELDSFKQIKSVLPAKNFIGKLRKYQKEGVGWLNFLHQFRLGGCLADDMGLGKTVQVLAFLQKRKSFKKNKTALIVVPRSLIFNWQEEVLKFTPDLKVYIHGGLNRKAAGRHFFEYDIVLTTYGTLRRDIKDFKEIKFGYIILDEAQAIKNASSLTAKASRLLQADQRLAMSGTPIENHIGELWSLFEFLNPGFLGKISSFKKVIASGESNEFFHQSINKILKPFILRRTKKEVAKDLPDRVEQTIVCEMQDKQKKDYLKLQKYYQQNLLGTVKKEGLNKSKIHVLEALLRLRQVACHPALVDKKAINASSAKVDTLLDSLKEIVTEGSKALVFSQFTSFLTIIRKKLDEEKISYLYLDGKTRNRKEVVEKFQNDDSSQIFLISLKAGGLGLNLTRAEYVFLLDPWWNPAVEAQAIDRAHRIGQTKTVFAYRLIVKDSVEEKILKLQAKKKELADSIIISDNNLIKDLSMKDLTFLLS